MDIDPSTAALISATLLALVGIVYFAMAFGLRSGELIWSERHVGRLPTEQRWWSFLYGLGLILSGFVLVEMAGATDTGWISDRWLESAGFVVMSFLGLATLIGLIRGSTWERMIFAPVTLLGALLAAWLTFN